MKISGLDVRLLEEAYAGMPQGSWGDFVKNTERYDEAKEILSSIIDMI